MEEYLKITMKTKKCVKNRRITRTSCDSASRGVLLCASFVFCIAGGSNSDGGFKIFSQRPDGSDQMTLNANNAKSGW